LAVAQTEVSSSAIGFSDEKTLTGWTVGAGVEVAIDDTWSVSAEYIYTDLGDETWFEGEAFQSSSKSTANSVRVSVNAGF
jgi:outer membrane immunogenic protein